MSSGRSFGLRINARFKPPQNVTTPFRFLDGDYVSLAGVPVPFYQYFLHWSARTNRGFICSKKWEMTADGDIQEIGGKCLGCEAMEEDSKSIDRRLMHVFNGIHLAYYHEVQATDKAGKGLVYSKGEREGQPVLERVPCKGRVCELCKKKVDKVFGKKVHYSVGTGHLDNIVGFTTEIEKSCRCGGQLTAVTYGCVKCQAVWLDATESEMSDEDLLKYRNNVHKCPECGHVDLPFPEFECDSCNEPKSLGLFDVDVDIKRQGEGTKSTLQIGRWVHKELSEELQEMAHPWPFDKIFSPDSFDYQAKCLKIDNPYTDGKAEEHAEGYDEQEAEDPDLEG